LSFKLVWYFSYICLICYFYCFTYVWATVSALMCLVCPVPLSYVAVLYVLFHENKENGYVQTPIINSKHPHM